MVGYFETYALPTEHILCKSTKCYQQVAASFRLREMHLQQCWEQI